MKCRILKQRQKVVRISNESEMGWQVVDEYIQSDVASDEKYQNGFIGHKRELAGKRRQTGVERR